MATADDVKAVLDVLCRYYREKGEPRHMDEVQIAVYLDGLNAFPSADLERAARQWMQTSRWFPALSDLREQLIGKVNWEALAVLAWTAVEKAIRQAGVYRGVVFEDPAIGETVRQVFGSWEHVCSYDRDSPGWTLRRQAFIALFPMVAAKADKPVVMRGLHANAEPMLVPHVEYLPMPQKQIEGPDRSQNVLSEITKRFKAIRDPKETP